MSEDDLNKLKDEIREEIISGLTISINTSSWGPSEYRTHEISVQLFFDSIEFSSSSIMLE